MLRAIDSLVAAIVLLLVATPFTRMVLPLVGEVNVKSNLLLLLTGVCLARLVLAGVVRNWLFLAVVVYLFALYFSMSVILGRDQHQVAAQVFEYAPFLAACFVLASGTTIEYSRLSAAIIIAVAVSGSLAAYIFYFNNQWAPSTFEEGDYSWGRLPWRGATNTIVVLGIFLFANRRVQSSLLLSVAVVACVVAALLSFSRTLFLAVLIMLVSAGVAALIRRQASIQWRFYLTLVGGVILSIMVFDFENLADLLDYRFIGLITQSSDFSEHVGARTELYPQYYSVFASYPVLGAGFGVPFATTPEITTYSDVTVVSFGLPFGLAGVFMFVAFVRLLWRRVGECRSPALELTQVGLRSAILVGLLVSLNDDIWSHKEFSLVLTLLIASFANSARRVPGRLSLQGPGL